MFTPVSPNLCNGANLAIIKNSLNQCVYHEHGPIKYNIFCFCLRHPGLSCQSIYKMAASSDSGTGDGQNQAVDQPPDRLKTLYPTVNPKEHPLPRFWSQKDKYNFIGLSQNFLRVHYKGESTIWPLLSISCASKNIVIFY